MWTGKRVKALAAVGVVLAVVVGIALPASADAIPPVPQGSTRATSPVANGQFGAYWLPWTVTLRHPGAYGWPNACLLVTGQWTSVYDSTDHRMEGTTFAQAKDVVDNGSCSGPIIQNNVTIFVEPHWWNYYGVESPSLFLSCSTGAQGPFGISGAGLAGAPACAHPTYNAQFGDWTRGYESERFRVITDHYAWPCPEASCWGYVTAARLI